MENSKNQTKTIKTKLSFKKDTNCNKLELYNKITELGKNVDPSKYKHLVLGLILLKHISDSDKRPNKSIVNTNKNTNIREINFLIKSVNNKSQFNNVGFIL